MTFRILLVEDNPTWRNILADYIAWALPDSELEIAVDYKEASSRLSSGNWDLLVTDIGLPPDTGHVLGIRLVGEAKHMEIPCIVVSGTEAVTKSHVRDLLLLYQARDFFTKEELESRTQRQFDFQNILRSCAEEKLCPKEFSDEQRDEPRVKVTIGIGSETLYLTADTFERLTVAEGTHTRVFMFFAQNVVDQVPGKVVKHSLLNEVLGLPGEDKASQQLRNTIKQLNDEFKKWAKLEVRWINRAKREPGYCLDTASVQWHVERDLIKRLRAGRTLWDVLVDPHKMAQNTPTREEH